MGEEAGLIAGFFILRINTLKTRVYIDGFNLYYGCLRGTSFKWLDIFKLFYEHVLPSSSHTPSDIDLYVKYFTAQIIDKAAKSSTSVQDQTAYHRALGLVAEPGRFEIIKGYYSLTQTTAYQFDRLQPKVLPKDSSRVDIWKLEEKQTDVNIAVESLYDVMTDPELKQVVFVTNDTDLAPAMKKIQALGKVTVGLVIPTTFSARRPNQDLAKHANWVRDCIQDYELAASQLPRLIPGERKPAVKPISWYGQPEILEQITQTLMPVCEQKLTKCWRWLEHPVPIIEGLSPLVGLPINHLNTEQEALLVLKYAEKFAEMMANAQT